LVQTIAKSWHLQSFLIHKTPKTPKTFYMKIYLLGFCLLLGTSAIAQTESGNRTQLGKHYWGIGSGYYGATRNFSGNGVETFYEPITIEKEFVYGRRLVNNFYLEVGLSYSHRSARNIINGRPTGSNVNTFYNLNTETTQFLIVPVAIRYRSSGSELRFISGATIGGFGIGGRRTNSKDFNQTGDLLQEDSRVSRSLAFALGLGINAGVEYQANPNWMLRAETHFGLEGGGGRGGLNVTPGLSFGLYRSLR
jgi:hypothetical protein